MIVVWFMYEISGLKTIILPDQNNTEILLGKKT